jgi:hypothetical protein
MVTSSVELAPERRVYSAANKAAVRKAAARIARAA